MNASTVIDRRDFLARTLPVGLCLGCGLALAPDASAQEPARQDTPPATPADPLRKEGGSARPGMSYEQVFNFTFRDHSIPYLLALADKIGRKELVEMLKTATDEISFRKYFEPRFHRDVPADFWAHVVVQELVEETEKVRVVKVTRCRWAETYRAANAADIGYAMWCQVDYASARLRREKLERSQTLMQGHDCCLLKWTKEA
jgi:hypothetical protein